MKDQFQGMPQRQQSGSSDLQLWQQQLMYKQLQELEQRQQISQINQISMQQTYLGQLSASRRLSTDMLPPLHNGLPTNNVPNVAWQNELVESDQPKMLNNSQRFPGNSNWVHSSMHGLQNGVMFNNEAGQPVQPMSFISQQGVQSLHGMPVSINRRLSNPYTHVEGQANASNSALSKAIKNQNASQSVYGVFVDQGTNTQDSMLLGSRGFRGNGPFSNDQSQSPLCAILPAESYRDNQSHSSHVQKVEACQGPGWLGNSADKSVIQSTPSHGASSLDPTEKKLLFGSDDDVSWDASFSRSVLGNAGGFVHNSSGNENYLGGLSSCQSGSFSALMLDALDATTSENAEQEEWSGLSLQKTEALAGNRNSGTNGNTSTWNGNNIQNQSYMSSRDSPFFNEAEGRVSQTGPAFQLSSGTFVYDQNERLPADASTQKQGLKEGNFMHLDQKLLQKQLGTGGLQAKMQLDDTVSSVWARNDYDKTINVVSAPGRELPSSNLRSVWSHQQNLFHSNQMQDCSNMTEMHVPNGNDTSNFHGHTDQEWHSQAGDMNWNMHANMYQDDDARRSGRNHVDPTHRMDAPKRDPLSSKIYVENSCVDHFDSTNSNMFNSIQGKISQMGNNQQPNFGFHDGSFEKTKVLSHSNQQHPSNGPVSSDPSVNVRVLVQARNNKQEDHLPQRVSDELHVSGGSNPINLSGDGNVPAENSVFTQYRVHNIDRNQSVDHDQNLLMLQRFQNPTMGNILMNMNAPLNAQGVTQLQGFCDQESSGQSQYVGRVVGENCMGKGQLSDIRRNAEGPDDTQAVDSIVRNDSAGRSSPFDAKAGLWSQKMEIGRTSQNMLELLQKVDQPSEDTRSPEVNFSRHHASEIPETAGFIPQSGRSSVFHGFGLRLSPPTDRHSSGTPDSSNRTYSHDTNINKLEKDVCEEKGPLVPSEASYRKENIVGGSNISASNTSFSFIENQLQTNISSSDNYSYLAAQYQAHDTGHSQQVPPHFPHFNSQKQASVFETRLASQASTKGMTLASQHDSLPPVLHNVWRNVGPQRPTNALPKEFALKVVQPMVPLTTGKDTSSPLLQEPDAQRDNSRAAPSSYGTHSVNSQQFNPRTENHIKGVSLEHMPLEMVGGQRADSSYQGHISERIPFSVSPAYQQDLDHGGRFNNPAEFTSQQLNMPFQKGSSNQDIGTLGHSAKLSSIHLQKYSLLRQMQAMKGADSEMRRVAVKQVKESELGIDEKNMDQKTSPLYTYGQSSVLKGSSDSDQRITRQNTFSPDLKILSFSSRENEDTNSSSSFDFIPREFSSQDMHSIGPELQNISQSLSKNDNPAFFGTNAYPLIASQVVPPQFRPLIKQHLLAKFGENMDISSMLLQRNDINSLGIVDRIAPTNVAAIESVSPHCESYTMDHNELLKIKKRKTFTSELPWHKEVLHSPQRRRTISIAELEWAYSANRLVDKVEDDMEIAEDGPLIPRSQKRLILTTQLMQQLIPSVPSQILTEEARLSYESVTYFIARSALGDACSMSCDLGSVCSIEEQGGTTLVKAMEVKHGPYADDVENFLDRSRKLQSLSQRLFGTTTSLLDLRLECQDLERFSIVNCLAKFHGRSQAEVASNPAHRRLYPQRYVMALPVTGILPEGVPCLPI